MYECRENIYAISYNNTYSLVENLLKTMSKAICAKKQAEAVLASAC